MVFVVGDVVIPYVVVVGLFGVYTVVAQVVFVVVVAVVVCGCWVFGRRPLLVGSSQATSAADDCRA